jgi:hypothetical protein
VKAIRISAGKLGELVMDDFCARCYWLKLQLNHHLPFQIFPSIYSSIDSYTKDIVHSWFRHPRCAAGLAVAARANRLLPRAPTLVQVQTINAEHGIHLAGVADAIFQYADGSYLIADYKMRA